MIAKLARGNLNGQAFFLRILSCFELFQMELQVVASGEIFDEPLIFCRVAASKPKIAMSNRESDFSLQEQLAKHHAVNATRQGQDRPALKQFRKMQGQMSCEFSTQRAHIESLFVKGNRMKVQ